MAAVRWLQRDALMEDVVHEVGPGDLGWRDLPTEEAITVLLDSLRTEAHLTELGAIAAHAELKHLLVLQRRAGLVGDAERGRLVRPIVIGGLPRTGTTLLHHLLAGHAALTAPAVWETYRPTVHLEAARGDGRVVRRTRARASLRCALLQQAAPRAFAMHPMAADDPDECTPVLAASLLSLQLLVMFRVPSYASWLFDQSLAPAYAFWREQMECLATVRGERRFVFKSPTHLFGHTALREAAPDVTLVQVRRAWPDTIGSMLNLVQSVREVYSDDVEPTTLAAEWLPILRVVLDRAEASLASFEGRLDIDYAELVAEPARVVGDVCASLGVDSGDSVDAVASATALRQRLGPAGRLPLDAFASPERIERLLADHIDATFLAPSEQDG